MPALADPKMKARLADLGGRCFPARLPTSAGSSPTKPRNGRKVILAANIKAEARHANFAINLVSRLAGPHVRFGSEADMTDGSAGCPLWAAGL